MCAWPIVLTTRAGPTDTMATAQLDNRRELAASVALFLWAQSVKRVA
jgi:hypothetical protein